MSRKLASRADGPYFVKKVFPTTAAVQIEDRAEFVSLDRIAPAPAPIIVEGSGPSSAAVDDQNQDSGLEESVVKRISKHRLLRKKGVNKRKPRYEYQVEWFDGDVTWEPISHIPRHFIIQYCNRTTTALPVDIDQAQVG